MAEARASRLLPLGALLLGALLYVAIGAGAARAQATTLVRGQVLYEDVPYSPAGQSRQRVARPARGARVTVHGADGEVSTRTDGDGRFALEVTLADPLTVEAAADVRWDEHRARVVDRSKARAVYRLEAPWRGAPVELVARADDGLGGPFNIADQAFEAFAFYAPHVRTPGPPLTFEWARGEPFACGSCYTDDLISVGGQAADTDEYDDDILLHEIGHYFVERFSRDSSPGGFHRDRQVDPRLAYGEGLAYFFACAVRGTPVVVDTYASATRVIDIDRLLHDGEARANMRGTSNRRGDGALREETTAAILWDALDDDDPSEPFDRVSLGRAGIMALLVRDLAPTDAPDRGPRGLDLTDLLDALVCARRVPADDVQALATEIAFPWRPPACAR